MSWSTSKAWVGATSLCYAGLETPAMGGLFWERGITTAGRGPQAGGQCEKLASNPSASPHSVLCVFTTDQCHTDEGFLISTSFMQNEDTEMAKHSSASRAQGTSCKTIGDSTFASPTPCVPKTLPVLLGKPFQHLPEPGQGPSASSHPGTELSYVSNIFCWS